VQRDPRPRKTASLSRSMQQQLNMYAFAAGAAGVGVLALALPADAKIVYTPAQEQLPPGFGISLYLDLNHDGVNDFYFVNFYSRTSSMIALWLSPDSKGNEIFSHSGSAAALPANVRVGPKGKFKQLNLVGMVSDDLFHSRCKGPWDDVNKRYLGLKFTIKGKTHFGWARLNVSCVYLRAINATLTGYAYESIPNKPIITGKTKGPDESVEPATLGHLARGAGGISNRRVQQAAETSR
jgi:hypothetical protein